mmetsp:Transcript_4136/g.6304  ORF Transcript_4136/g.6304 Transcript_4136/m.6304 type:complete len:951 (+) Transcript_4136:635-3487(+)
MILSPHPTVSQSLSPSSEPSAQNTSKPSSWPTDAATTYVDDDDTSSAPSSEPSGEEVNSSAPSSSPTVVTGTTNWPTEVPSYHPSVSVPPSTIALTPTSSPSSGATPTSTTISITGAPADYPTASPNDEDSPTSSPSGAPITVMTTGLPSFVPTPHKPAVSINSVHPSSVTTSRPSADPGLIVTDPNKPANPVVKTSIPSFAPSIGSSGNILPTAAPIIDPTTLVKATVQFYYLIELNQFFSEQEIQSESNNSIKSSLSKAIVSVLSSSNNLSRTRRRYVHHNHHNVVGIQFPRRFLSLDANVTHDLVNNVDCPNNQSQGSCFYMTSSVVVAVAQTLDPIDVVLEIIENSMSPMSDDFVNAMADNYAEKVTFGGQGIYERSVVPQAVVQGDEGDGMDAATLTLIVIAGGLLLFATAISVAVCRRREKYTQILDDGMSTDKHNLDVEDMEKGVHEDMRALDNASGKQLSLLGVNSMLVEVNEDDIKNISGYEVREEGEEVFWDDGEDGQDEEHVMKIETMSANSIPQFVVPSGVVSNSDTTLPREQSDAELLELAIEAGKWVDVATYARALNGNNNSGISPLSTRSHSKSIGSSGSRTKLSLIDQKRAAVIDTFVELRNWNAVIDTAEKFGQNQSLEDALHIPAGTTELNVQTSSLSAQASSMSLRKSTSSNSATKVNTGVVSEAVRRRKVEEVRKQIITLIVDAAPHEINNVDAMMEQFHGREEELLETIKLMDQRQKIERSRWKQVGFTGVDSISSSVKDGSATHSGLDNSALSSSLLGSMLPDDQSVAASSVSDDKAKIMNDLNKAIEAGDWRQVERRASALHKWESDSDDGDEEYASSLVSAISGSYGTVSYGQASSDIRSAVSGLSSPSVVSSAASSAFESIDSSLFGAEDAMKLEAIEGLMESEDWEGLVALTNKRSTSNENSAESDVSYSPSDEDRSGGFGVTG